MRAGIVMAVYDEARQNDQKHSVAVRQAVEFVKQNYPALRISETAVRRILAEWRPLLPDINNPSKTATKFVFGFGERPNYPRSNRKITKD